MGSTVFLVASVAAVSPCSAPVLFAASVEAAPSTAGAVEVLDPPIVVSAG